MRFEKLPHRGGLAICLLALALIGGGCTSPVGEPLPQSLAGNDPDAQIAFWHTLPTLKTVTNDQAFHALLLFADSQDPAGDYDTRVQQLKDRKMLDTDFHAKSEEAVRRGTVAVALVRILDIHGGLTMRIFGNHARYAERELEYAGLYPPSSPQQVFSGAEFLGIIGRAEDYQRGSSGGAEVLSAEDAQQGLESTPPEDMTNRSKPKTKE